jgi:hypothetical protein
VGLRSAFRRATDQVRDAVRDVRQDVRRDVGNLAEDVRREARNVVVAPIKETIRASGVLIDAAAPVVGSAVGVLRQNPELAGLAGAAIGVPGLGGLFGGSGGGPATEVRIPNDPAPGPTGGPPPWHRWALLGAGAALVVGLVLLLRGRR